VIALVAGAGPAGNAAPGGWNAAPESAYGAGMDDLDSGLFVLRALAGPMMAIVTALVTVTIFAPVVLYVVARWRAHREPEVDRQLGIKFALHYFAISAFQLALVGGTMLVWATISSAPSAAKSGFYRAAMGMLVPAGLVLAAHVSLLRRTDDARMTGVRRLFAGYNLIVTGLLGFVALVLAFQALFAKGRAGELGRVAGAMVLVYGTAWAVIGWRFGQLVLGGHGGDRAEPGAPTTAATPPPATTGLPSLGGGSFPPIDPKA
jgi:hypothetical protein